MTLLDLSQRLDSHAFVTSDLPSAVIELHWCLDDHPSNITRMAMTVHTGTHIDAPRHFYADGATVDELPLDCATGPAVGWTVERRGGEQITVDDLRRNDQPLERGDLLFLHTGWGAHYDDHERYRDHPHLSEDAAHWLIEQGVRMVAMDLPTPDLAKLYRPEGFGFPVHRALLGAGVLVGEHLANLDRVAGRRFRAIGLPLPLVGSDGGPTRFVAEL